MAIYFRQQEIKKDASGALKEAVFLGVKLLKLTTGLSSPVELVYFAPTAFSSTEKIWASIRTSHPDTPEAKAWVWLSSVIFEATLNFLQYVRRDTPLKTENYDETIIQAVKAEHSEPLMREKFWLLHKEWIDCQFSKPVFSPGGGR